MNVVKKDAIDDKIIERCKTYEKQCMQENLNGLRSAEMLSSRSQPWWIDQLSSTYRVDIKFLDGSRSY